VINPGNHTPQTNLHGSCHEFVRTHFNTLYGGIKTQIQQEVSKYVEEKHDRHWSKPYIYIMMSQNKLPYFKIGGASIILKETIDKIIKTFKRKAPPKMEIVKPK